MGDQRPDPLESAKACWSRISTSPVYNFLFSDIEVVSATVGSVKARLEVKQQHINSKGTLHGSVSATIVDWAGGMAIATHGLEKTGLSTDIHVTYTAGAKLGDVLVIEGRTTKVGRVMAFTVVDIHKTDENTPVPSMVAHGTHSKYISQDT